MRAKLNRVIRNLHEIPVNDREHHETISEALEVLRLFGDVIDRRSTAAEREGDAFVIFNLSYGYVHEDAGQNRIQFVTELDKATVHRSSLRERSEIIGTISRRAQVKMEALSAYSLNYAKNNLRDHTNLLEDRGLETIRAFGHAFVKQPGLTGLHFLGKVISFTNDNMETVDRIQCSRTKVVVALPDYNKPYKTPATVICHPEHLHLPTVEQLLQHYTKLHFG